MKHVVSSVGRRLALLVGVGLLVTVTIVGVSLKGVQDIGRVSEQLGTASAARQLALQLDTRASEVKADAYKALVIADPTLAKADVVEDTATTMALVQQLQALPLDGEVAAAVDNVEQASRTVRRQV